MIFWYHVKYIALIPTVYVFIILGVQILTSHFCIHFRFVLYNTLYFPMIVNIFRSKISKITDSRLKLVSEVVKSMRVVKMFCLESIFTTQISKFRK
jgi:hypothetical protein